MTKAKPNTPAPKKRTGPKPLVPTAEQRFTVRNLSAIGTHQDKIASVILNPKTGKAIDAKTLRAHFRHELDNGRPSFQQEVINGLADIAGIGLLADSQRDEISTRDRLTALIFLGKTVCGLRETAHVQVDATVTTGVIAVPDSTSDDAELQRRFGGVRLPLPGEN